MASGRTWTKLDKEYLDEYWGKSTLINLSIQKIAPLMGRSYDSIERKFSRLKYQSELLF